MSTPWKLPRAYPAVPGGGRVLTPADREFHQYSHPGVWGALADERHHNPFRDFDFEENAVTDRHGWDTAADAHPGYVKDFHEAYARHLAKAHPLAAVPTALVPQIVQAGRLKSQFETGTSKGVHDTEGRADVEEHAFGYPQDLAPHARPFYGFLSAHPFTDAAASGYGHTSLVLHKPAIWHRTTFSGDDSWNRLHEVPPVPVNDYAHDPHSFRHAVPIEHLGFDEDMSRRLSDSDMARRMEDKTPEERAHTFWRGGTGERRWGAHAYPEAQYHGGVHLHDVRFAIVRSPDQGRTAISSNARQAMDALTEAGIPWVHTVGFTKPTKADRAFTPSDRERPLPPHFPERRAALQAPQQPRTANLLTDLASTRIFHPDVAWQRPGGRGYLLTLDGTHNRPEGPWGKAADPEWGLSGAHPIASFLARGYWEPADGVKSEDVMAVTPRGRR